ncbi:MAG: hypothetical protein KF699_08575 [Phycisphaeraceae bacterium]|nr:hypothetical protein [Phycisphaeraceae bacterium]MBX3406142.1 hypothetical protein [Phycisphaeraceae bacterium]
MQSSAATSPPAPSAPSPRATAATRRTLACWAMDLLSLRRRGLLVPDWERLTEACERAGLVRPPAPEESGVREAEAA